MKLAVASVRGHKRGDPTPWDVYVGRGRCPCALPSCPHGPAGFGNPCVGKPLVVYLEYLAERMTTQPAFREAVYALEDKTLGCWCVTVTVDDLLRERITCHAMILARAARRERFASIRAALEAA